MNNKVIIYWHRQDLRLEDNLALTWASNEGLVVPIFINDQQLFDDMYIGSAQKWWLHHSLTALQKDYQKHKINLILRMGDPKKVLGKLIKDTSATAIVWNRCYDPASMERDMHLKEYFKEQGIEVHSFNSFLLTEPSKILNLSKGFYKVFTPFWKSARQTIEVEKILPVPHLSGIDNKIESDKIDDWKFLPISPNWAKGFSEYWQPGEKGAHEKMDIFYSNALNSYQQSRNIPAKIGTSQISPHLKFGEIGPRQIWHKIMQIAEKNSHTLDIDRYLFELGWREFNYYLLYHFKKLPSEPFNEKFNAFPWARSEKNLKAWQKGLTGYPMVDAGMRELWHTGWMHNRVRMVVGSFLTKHLLISWQKGAEWFLDTLVDGDIANNCGNWQWVSGSGADAAPYFRIFNPVMQGEKFDAKGEYVRKWVPELKDLPDKYIHSPWKASEELLKGCGVTLGKNYPKPVVDHDEARKAALEAYAEIKGNKI